LPAAPDSVCWTRAAKPENGSLLVWSPNKPNGAVAGRSRGIALDFNSGEALTEILRQCLRDLRPPPLSPNGASNWPAMGTEIFEDGGAQLQM